MRRFCIEGIRASVQHSFVRRGQEMSAGDFERRLKAMRTTERCAERGNFVAVIVAKTNPPEPKASRFQCTPAPDTRWRRRPCVRPMTEPAAGARHEPKGAIPRLRELWKNREPPE